MDESIRALYNRIDEKLDDVHFEALWAGFHRFPFALYDEETVYLADEEIPWDNRFLANTSILFEGKSMAIWNIQMEHAENEEVLAADIVHEMFHCFQIEQGEHRYANDLEILCYPMVEENFQLKQEENQRLLEIFREADSMEKQKKLSEFIEIRKMRQDLIGEHFQNELKVETIEGAAEFVGLSALKKLDEEQYQQKISSYLDLLEAISPLLFDIRRNGYYTGALFYFAMLDLGYEIQADLSAEQPIYELMVYDVEEIEVEPTNDLQLPVLLEDVIKEKDEKIQEFLSQEPEETLTQSTISGYDPMNMFRQDDWIYCEHFVYLKSDETLEKLFVSGPVLLKMIPGHLNEIESYFILK